MSLVDRYHASNPVSWQSSKNPEHRLIDRDLKNFFTAIDEKKKLESEVGDLKAKLGQLKIEQTQLQQQLAEKENHTQECYRDLARELGQAKQATGIHNMLVKSLGKMIHETVKKANPTASNNITAKKAMEIAENSVKQFEGLRPQENFIHIPNKTCLRMTPKVAEIILDIFENYPCTEPDLTLFKDELDSAALRTVLSNRNITKVTFARSAQEAEAVQIAQEIAKRRSLEIAFA